MKKVYIVQKQLCHYRIDLFEKMREKLSERNIELGLIHGLPAETESAKRDTRPIEWAQIVENWNFKCGNSELCYQPYYKIVKDSNLVIITQENSLLMNYLLLISKRFSRRKVAFWGHGRNFQSTNPSGPKEIWKKYWLNKADWWFAYTDVTKNLLRNCNYPEIKITVLNNAIDTDQMIRDAIEIVPDDLQVLKKRLGIQGNNVGVYCGTLYPQKQIDFLIAACKKIKEMLDDFSLIVIGAGPDENKVKHAASQYPWIHYIGPKYGKEKVQYLSLAKVFLMPSTLGLAILDAFACGLPVFTTNGAPTHGPEICYLINGLNGIVTNYTVEAYSAAVIRVLVDEELRLKMSENSRADSKKYTLEKMADNFVNGIENCIQCVDC